MSYDLSFWRQFPDIDLEPLSIQRLLLDGESVEGIAEIPIADMRQRVSTEFGDWTKVDPDIWEREVDSEVASFELFTTRQFFHVTCRGMMDFEDMNRLIDIAFEFDCPLFDPQINKRFVG